jgi:isopentenyl phosphate kinase
MAVRTQLNPQATEVGDGRKTVTTAGTAVALSSTSVPVLHVDITAETDNTGIIVVGGSGVVAALATREGTPLNAGDTQTLYNVDLKDVFIDTTVNTDGVTFTYVAGTR